MNWQPTQRVVCAACKYDNGVMLVGPRHFDAVMRDQYERYGLTQDEGKCVQGFLDQYGNFLTREEAHKIAVANGQRRYRCGGDETRLFSENLY